MPVDGSNHVWLGNMYRGAGVADNSNNCSISLPLTTEPLSRLLHNLKAVMKHNFLPCVLTMAGK